MQHSIEATKKNKIKTDRVFHYLKGDTPGSTIVFFAAVHGNELAGVHGLNNFLKNQKSNDIKGEIYGVYGNIQAIQLGQRYVSQDLNRAWTEQNIKNVKSGGHLVDEEEELRNLLLFLENLLSKKKGPIYFIDLHTTSSQSIPFITINDTLSNRKFSKCFPVPIVLGIEEYLNGTLLSYLNTKGFISIGFEAGQHTDPLAIEHCEAFIHLALACSGILKNSSSLNLKKSRDKLNSVSQGVSSFFEIIDKYQIEPNEVFVMEKGFKSFETIKKGVLLAYSNGQSIHSEHSGNIFMPLYQKFGEDGFFIIRDIPVIYLWWSRILRNFKADALLTLLPGIKWENKSKGILIANLKTTRFMAKQVFHLFGFRQQILNKGTMLLYNRERVSRNNMYKKEPWY